MAGQADCHGARLHRSCVGCVYFKLMIVWNPASTPFAEGRGATRIITPMLRIFVYEHITALGLGREAGSPGHSLFVEGRAMLDAIRGDFAAIPGVEVLSGPPEDFGKLAAEADWSFVIAPETDGVLLKLAEEVERVGGRLLGPSPAAIALTSDKYALYKHWRKFGIRTPKTVLWPELPKRWPSVAKLRDGAGSEGMKLVKCEEEYAALSGSRIAQPFCPGIPASIAFLVGAKKAIPLPATFQYISTDGQFRYGGGLLPLAKKLNYRAEIMGFSALSSIPGLLGYVGVDLILGDSRDGDKDCVLEINPRLTTSYIGLRALFEVNLAEQLLALNPTSQRRKPRDFEALSCLEQLVPPARRVAFLPDGRTQIDPTYCSWKDPSEFSENCPG